MAGIHVGVSIPSRGEKDIFSGDSFVFQTIELQQEAQKPIKMIYYWGKVLPLKVLK